MPMAKSQRTMLAAELFRLGLRTPHVAELSKLSKDSLSKIHREIFGRPATKGQLPYSIEWFMKWRHNMHASLFLKIYSQPGPYVRDLNLMGHVGAFPAIGDDARQFLNAYWQYVRYVESVGDECFLNGQRAYLATQLIGKAIWLAPCCECGQQHLVYAYSEGGNRCGNCFVPNRIRDDSKTRHLGGN